MREAWGSLSVKGRKDPQRLTARQRVGSTECMKRAASSPIADRVQASWAPELGPGGKRVRPGAWPEYSPSSEEKEADVSMALWKFSSIFRPSSMFGPGREDL